MREVLRDGKTEGRVSILETTKRPHAHGVGALADLGGEIFIEDGNVWVSRVVAPNKQLTQKVTSGDLQATLLVAAYVRSWRQIPLEHDVSPAELEAFVAAQIRAAELDVTSPTPVLMVGEFHRVNGHVVNGHCPTMSGDNKKANVPQYAGEFPEIWGRVVGFYAEGQEGVLMHHGSKTHLHFLSDDQPRLMMHVDQLGLKQGSVLFLPIRERAKPGLMTP
jgi:alpha-acetolactate decarboxylase